MIAKDISLDKWSALFDAAIKFKRAGCWAWMYDDEIFGIQNPQTGEIGYACILGNLGEMFALNVYLGAAGLAGYRQMLERTDEDENDIIEIMSNQLCLQAAFVDRYELNKEDLMLIKKLGYRFKGKSSWPLFRNYTPTFFPWYLEESEVEYLTVALEQTLEVALRVRENKNLLPPPRSNIYFTRTAHHENKGLVWQDEYLKPPVIAAPEIVNNEADDIGAHRIKKKNLRRHGYWEIDIFLYPHPVQEGKERPYHPYLFIIMDSETQMVLTTELAPATNYIREFRNAALVYMEKNNSIPKIIAVKRPLIYEMLKPIAALLQIALVMEKHLQHAEVFQKSLYESMGKGF